MSRDGSEVKQLCTHLDVVGVSEQHGEAVNAEAPASSGWQAILQGCAEVLINKHGLVISLGTQHSTTQQVAQQISAGDARPTGAFMQRLLVRQPAFLGLSRSNEDVSPYRWLCHHLQQR
jgi:hypothetical protein